MNDIQRPHSRSTVDTSPRRRPKGEGWQAKLKRSVSGIGRWFKSHKQAVAMVILVVVLMLGAVGLYKLGYKQGEAAQKKADEKLLATRRDPLSQALQNRSSVAYSGKVEAISDTEITVKPTNGDTKKLVIDKDTIITDAKNARIDTKAIKKGEQVSVFGATKDGKTIARRIRVVATPSTSPSVTPKR